VCDAELRNHGAHRFAPCGREAGELAISRHRGTFGVSLQLGLIAQGVYCKEVGQDRWSGQRRT
jgi:hypothetical protein